MVDTPRLGRGARKSVSVRVRLRVLKVDII